MNKRLVTVSGYMIFLCPFLPNEKSIHFLGYTYSQCPLCFRPDGEQGGGLWAGVRGSRLFACHNCTIAFSNPLVNISELM